MYDVAIVGCGVIGASLAYQLAQYRLRVLILERENDVAMGTTKANSAIVHAGYDPEHGTMMAKLNVQGSAMMGKLCRDLQVGYQQIGSLVLAFDENDQKKLQKLYENGVENGVPDLALLSAKQAHEMEPNLSKQVCGALYAPSAAIVDPWGLCIAQAETAVRNGVEIKLNADVCGLEQSDDGIVLHTTQGDFSARYVVNCAGGNAHTIAKMTTEPAWQAKPQRGEYYLLDKICGKQVQHVIFQCPSALGKGVLVAPTVHGNLIVGPNAENCDSNIDKRTTTQGLTDVECAAKRSVPDVNVRQCIRTFAGVRAITDQADFIIQTSEKIPQLLHLAGIKSPGLSAAPAIGVYAIEKLAEMGLPLTPNTDFDGKRTHLQFHKLSVEEKTALIAQNPLYGRIICRCETITEGEIVDAIHSPIPPCSIDGIKRRAGAGMGRCQGGFCAPRVMEIMARELQIPQADILQDGQGTVIITGTTKNGGATS